MHELFGSLKVSSGPLCFHEDTQREREFNETLNEKRAVLIFFCFIVFSVVVVIVPYSDVWRRSRDPNSKQDKIN